MSEELKYIDYDGALEVYRKTVAASGGGLQGVKDEGGIRKVLDFVQNDLYYPTFVDKLTYLVFGLCTGHYFEDSNKRVALTIGVWFLVHNGYYWQAYNWTHRQRPSSAHNHLLHGKRRLSRRPQTRNHSRHRQSFRRRCVMSYYLQA